MDSDLSIGRLRLKRTVMYSLIAVTAVVASAGWGELHTSNHAKKAVGIGAGVAFVLAGVAAVHRLAAEFSRAVRARTGGSAAATVEVTISAAGYLLVFVVALDLFDVSIQNLLLGGAITGVVLGIALQQILGNVFAGVALLLAHPFNIGDLVVLRNGIYGGEVSGTVKSVNLTYVILESEGSEFHVPNAGVLASAINTTRAPPRRGAPRVSETPQA